MTYDAYASYHWPSIGSALLGPGAPGIAIPFPPQPAEAADGVSA
ncbi:hypothetical protein [Mesorhizobium sp. M2A.F.Ca.ET.037.01.1.1]|nr:hypothetical protein [Mesorhizobium sp. M2A.F.Ca.ET.037.01.1.1]